jgi:6-pyruvoyltetrahydropterin/6-carboxytetrahydropterin synthase
MRIYKDFKFEAAHVLPSVAPGTANARVHGHSFRARILVEGEPDPATGYIVHFDELTAAISDTHDALDHRFLNDVEGLSTSTLEHIAVWIWNRLSNRVPGLCQVEVHRDSCNEGCFYRGPSRDIRLAAE